MGDEVREACGLFGIWGHPQAAQKTYYGLFALQHRGQESAGIAAVGPHGLEVERGMGLVQDVFSAASLDRLRSHAAMGHVRYSTTGSSTIANAQPLVARTNRGEVAVAHNGNLTNSLALRQELEARGSIFQATSDSEVCLHLLALPGSESFRSHLVRSLERLEGAFSLLFLTPEALIGVRDPHGFRPLVLGRVDDAYCLASETCALDLAGGTFVREIEPGEVCFIDDAGPSSLRLPPAPRLARCIFEYVYFARPDSFLYGRTVQEVRKRLGRELFREHPTDADVIVPMPDSGTAAALGYAEASGIPFDFGLVRNHYVGRTFIKPREEERALSVGLKLNAVAEVVRGKRLVVVDDSVVRGTTSRSRVSFLYRAGAREIHFRVSCPPIRHPCFFGIDFPTREELIAHGRDTDEIARILGVTSLGYLSLEGMLRAVGLPDRGHCTACWSGDYPVAVPDRLTKEILERT